MRLGNLIKRSIVITALVVIGLVVVFNYVGKALDKALNEPRGKPHTEMMLWKSPGYPKEPKLNFFKMEIYPSPETIRVVYKIENTSNQATDIENSIDIALVAGDANSIGDPGSTVWRWSEVRGERKINMMSLGPGEFFREEVSVDRKQVTVNFQYYINAYYKGKLVSQYKVIEGLYN